jgi:hypothetical protein
MTHDNHWNSIIDLLARPMPQHDASSRQESAQSCPNLPWSRSWTSYLAGPNLYIVAPQPLCQAPSNPLIDVGIRWQVFGELSWMPMQLTGIPGMLSNITQTTIGSSHSAAVWAILPKAPLKSFMNFLSGSPKFVHHRTEFSSRPCLHPWSVETSHCDHWAEFHEQARSPWVFVEVPEQCERGSHSRAGDGVQYGWCRDIRRQPI